MIVRWLVAALHLLALGIGLGAVWVRALALRAPLDTAGLRRALRADGLWGLAALIWISTGLWRAFGGLEKGAAYYLSSPFFWAKMSLLALIIGLEIWPATALTQWRGRLRRGQPVDTRPAARFATISFIQAGLVVAMVLAATAMARGVGAR